MSLCKEEENGEPGHLLACLVEKREQTKSLQCGDFLFQLESIVFSDYRIISKFADHCQADIGKLECGKARAGAGHSQGRVVACLSARLPELSPACSKEMSWLAELQVKTRLSSTIPYMYTTQCCRPGTGGWTRRCTPPAGRAGGRSAGRWSRNTSTAVSSRRRNSCPILLLWSHICLLCTIQFIPSVEWNGRDMR